MLLFLLLAVLLLIIALAFKSPALPGDKRCVRIEVEGKIAEQCDELSEYIIFY